MTATVLIFLKHPMPGQVKTRLAAVVGQQAAAQLYACWIGAVFQQLQPLRPHVRLIGHFTGGTGDDFAAWLALADAWWPQADGDLGTRLTAGFFAAHAAGGPVLAMGTDCLEISAALVEDALASLRNHDVVFGPATDGGYYLVGSARPMPGLFTGIRWSSAHTLADSLALCHAHGWRVHLLPVRQDIDTWADWQAYCRRKGATLPEPFTNADAGCDSPGAQ